MASAICRAIDSASSTETGPRNPGGQRLAVDELHHQCLRAVGLLETVDVGDVGVIERGEHFGLALERASRPGSEATNCGKVFSATSRFKRVSRARYTSPIPPAPIRSPTI